MNAFRVVKSPLLARQRRTGVPPVLHKATFRQPHHLELAADWLVRPQAGGTPALLSFASAPFRLDAGSPALFPERHRLQSPPLGLKSGRLPFKSSSLRLKSGSRGLQSERLRLQSESRALPSEPLGLMPMSLGLESNPLRLESERAGLESKRSRRDGPEAHLERGKVGKAGVLGRFLGFTESIKAGGSSSPPKPVRAGILVEMPYAETPSSVRSVMGKVSLLRGLDPALPRFYQDAAPTALLQRAAFVRATPASGLGAAWDL
jgi:hypothetical protein